MRSFLDANVLFSAAYVDRGHATRLFDLAGKGDCAVVSSGYALAEARRNLARKAPASLDHLAKLLPLLEVALDPSERLVEWAAKQGLPAKDAPILAAAIAARAALLVTGDLRHFASLLGRTIAGVRIVRPADAVRLVLDAAEREGG